MGPASDDGHLPPPALVAVETEIVEALAALASCPSVALDVEGDGFFRYRARLCTVQLASPGAAPIVVDTLVARGGPAMDRLRRLVGEGGPEKIVHDCTFDARLLNDAGMPLACVFDTSVAARFVGETSTGLSSLLKKYLDVDLAKAHQLADWGHRPLTEAELAYLADDVRYLAPLAEVLRRELARLGIEAEVAEECSYVLRQAAMPASDTRPLWARVKGYDRLSPEGQSILRELVLVREREAERRDLPPFKVLRNEVLLQIAERRPETSRGLRQIRGLDRGPARALAGVLLEAVAAGRRRGRLPDEELAALTGPRLPRAERAVRQARHKALTSWRKRQAEERQVDPQVVLPGHCLQALVAEPPRSGPDLLRIDGFGAARFERYGKELVELLQK